MLKRKEVAGVRVDIASLREALRRMEIYLNNDCINTVEMISMKTIVAAGEDEEVRQCLEEMDLVIPADREILQVLGIHSHQSITEADEKLFFHEFMKRVARGHHSVFVMTETEDQLEEFCAYLKETYGERLWICGSYAFETCTGDTEDIINEINSVTPHVVLSGLPSPLQEKFYQAHKQMFNAKVWFCASAENGLLTQRKGPKGLCRRFLVRRKMKRQILTYEESDKNE